MNREPDWPERLMAEIARHEGERFAWGRFDCALFACNVVNAMTGEDPAKEFRGRYRSERGARRALRVHGKGTLYATACHAFGRPIPPALAQRGDVVYLDRRHGGPALGICTGGMAAFAGDGVVYRPMSDIRCAWRTGRG